MKQDTEFINYIASLIKEDQEQVTEATDKKDIIKLLVSSLLTFMTGNGDKIAKDSEWMLYIINDIREIEKLFGITFDSDTKKMLDDVIKAHFDADDED